MAKLEIKLKKIRTSERVPSWNREILLSPNKKEKLKKSLDSQISECKEYVEEDFIQWKKLQSCMKKVAEEVCGRRKYVKKQPWITIEMLS